MFKFDYVDLQGKLVALVGALVFSTIFVGAAVGPVRAAEIAPVQVAAPASVPING